MLQLLSSGFDTSSLIPHGYCLQWEPGLLWTLVISNAIIAFSYFSIPFAIWYFARKRPDIPHRWLFILFGTFIISCGITHLLDVENIWRPDYWLDAIFRAITASLSLGTAIVLWLIMPKALHAPSAKEMEQARQALEEANALLETKVLERTRALQESNVSLKESEARFSSLANASPALIWVAGTDKGCTWFNDTWLAYTGRTMDQEIGNGWTESVHPEDLQHCLDLYTEHFNARQDFKMEYRLRAKDGEYRWFLDSGKPRIASNGDFVGYIGMMTDIDARKKLEESMQLASMVFASSSEGIMVTDAQNKIVAINPAFTTVTGYAAEDVIGKNPKLLQSGQHDKAFYESMWRSIQNTGQWIGEIWNRRKDGQVYAESLTINTIHNEDGTVNRRVAIFSDVTERKKTEDLIWNQANFDSLTGLLNRRMANDRLEQEIKKSARSGLPLALMLIDLDRFKEVNDTLGHDVGDVLLKEVAKRMLHCIRETDAIGRLGGDEFVVILSELEDLNSVRRIADEILDTLSQPFNLGSDVAYISGSIGISVYPTDAADAVTLLRNADQAMYSAKAKGKNCFQYYLPAMQEASNRRMQIISELHVALPHHELVVHYQPIVTLKNGEIHKAEALVRWNNPRLGLVSPATFIPLAEETGQIIDIGTWVFREASAMAARLRVQHSPDFQISVNKSPIQFRAENSHHLAWYKHLESIGLPCAGIVIEITEGLLMDASEEIIRQLLEFRDRGVQIALDDFGTGYSSLTYLKKFDIDYIKIDQSFIRNLSPESEDMALCEAMIVMAHRLGLQVIAEGIETPEQLALLRAAGCDYGQGYLWSRPVPAEEFEKLLAGP